LTYASGLLATAERPLNRKRPTEFQRARKLFRRGYNVATGSRHSRVGLDHSRCHEPPKTQTAGRVLCGKRRGTIILCSATREQAWRIFQQHRNAFIRSRINSSNWGTGPCPLWAFLQFCCRLCLHSPGCSGAHLPSSNSVMLRVPLVP
jgi:hypothetical protein